MPVDVRLLGGVRVGYRQLMVENASIRSPKVQYPLGDRNPSHAVGRHTFDNVTALGPSLLRLPRPTNSRCWV